MTHRAADDTAVGATVRPRVLVLIVVLWRSFQCGIASLEVNLLRANPDIAFSFVVATDSQTVASPKHPYGGKKAFNVTESVRSLLPSARVLLASRKDLQATAAPFDRINRFYSNPWFRRLRHALDSTAAMRNAFAATVVLRPDVQFNRPMTLDLTVRGLTVIAGIHQRNCFFSLRDWDFGYVASPPEVLDVWAADPAASGLNLPAPTPRPVLPPGFEGVWETHPDPNASVQYCGPNVTVFRDDTVELEHKILKLAQMGMPLRAMHVLPCCYDTFLSIIPPKFCDDALNGTLDADKPLTSWQHSRDICQLRALLWNGSTVGHERKPAIPRMCRSGRGK